MTGSDFTNSKWCMEGATEVGRAKVGKNFKTWTTRVGNYGLLAKAKQLYEFFLSPKIEGTQKAIVVGALLYLISPLDLIPDFIPVAGWLDDLGIAAFALNYIFATLGKIESANAEEVAASVDFKLSEQQVIDMEILNEGTAEGFKLECEPQTSCASLALKKRFEEVSNIARTLKIGNDESVDDNLLRMIFDTRLFHVAVVGRYSTGKSTLLNALLLKNLLPSKPIPTTKAVTYLLKSKCRSVGAEYVNGATRLEVDVDERDVLGVYNGMTDGNASNIVIALPDFPFSDLTLIDTPGIEDPDESITRKTIEIVQHCDAVIVLIDANYPQSKAEYEYIEAVANENASRKMFVVINKCDGKSPEECGAIKASCLDELKRRNVVNAEVHALSAIEHDNGFVSFRESMFAYLRSGVRNEVASYANSELDKYALSLQSVCSSLLKNAVGEVKNRENKEKLLAEKRRLVASGFDRQSSTVSKKIDGCKAQMRNDLANFMGELKSEARAAINASDFDTLKNTDAIALEINKKIKTFVDGQLSGLRELVSKELERSGDTLLHELSGIEIPLPKQVDDPSGAAGMFFPVTLAASYLLFGLSTAFIGTLVFTVLGRKFFESAIRDALGACGLANARTRIADDVSAKLGECEKKIWLQISEAVESVREKVLSAFETRRFECLSTCMLADSSDCLKPETVKDCFNRLAMVLDA